MKQIQTMGATEARNNFFGILENVFLNNQSYLIKKGNIPMAYISSVNTAKTEETDILDEILELKKKMKKGSDSVELIRQMRNER